MDSFSDNLKAIFQHSFQVKLSQTNRSDQWYKRRVQSWKMTTQNHGPLVLSPIKSKSEWAPNVLQCSSRLAQHIKSSAQDRLAQSKNLPLPTKLFPDSVFQSQPLMAEDRTAHTNQPVSPLAPSMQRIDFWTTDERAYERARAAKALLERGMGLPLLQLANKRSSRMKALAHIRHRLSSYHDWHDDGWLKLADDVMKVVIFLIIMAAFPETLSKNSAYQRWMAFGTFNTYNTPMERFIELHGHEIDDAKFVERYLDQCEAIIIHIEALSAACGLDEIDWNTKIQNSVLLFIGFEAWNRERYGQGYLGSNLNKPRYSSWLKQYSDDENDSADETEESVVKVSTKAYDPLYLLPPKAATQATTDSESESDSALDELAVLEAREAEYGIKRSEKYQTRHGPKNTK